MVYGGVTDEVIRLNEETVWTGGPYQPANPEGLEALPEVRRLVWEGRNKEAQILFGRKVMGIPARNQMMFQPVGDLSIRSDLPEGIGEYRRSLALDTGVVTVEGETWRRQVVASNPDDVIAIRIESDFPSKHTLSFLPPELLDDASVDFRTDGSDLVLTGLTRSLLGVEGRRVEYVARVRIAAEDGRVVVGEDQLHIEETTSATIFLAIATNVISYRQLGGDPSAGTRRVLDRAVGRGWDKVRSDHVADHRALYDRSSLAMSPSRDDVPTDARLASYEPENDPGLDALLFNYGRYLLVASSRPGGEPANLQGIWNERADPAWGSKYTTNINLEMNYWPAMLTGLEECAEPLLRFVEEVAESGAEVARTTYGARGWVLHHNSDLWRAAAPTNGPYWGTWPSAGAWLVAELWDQLRFGGTDEQRRRVADLARGVLLFFVDTLQEHPDGWLVTCPSSSPENHPKLPGNDPWQCEIRDHPLPASICAGPSVDGQLIRAVIDAWLDLDGDDAEMKAEVERIRDRLPPVSVGRWGQIQEWLEDWDDPEDQHRHVSHLWGLYPGFEFDVDNRPDLAAAAAVTLDAKGNGGPGWAKVWRAALWARLRRGADAAESLHSLFDIVDTEEIRYVGGGLYPNLMAAHPPFQVDANLGATAAIAEMLVQSHNGYIELLPALPGEWASGSLRGLRARGGLVLDIEWNHRRIERVTLAASDSRVVRLKTATELRSEKPLTKYGDLVEVEVEPDRKTVLVPA